VSETDGATEDIVSATDSRAEAIAELDDRFKQLRTQ